jgi:hypothetical protein
MSEELDRLMGLSENVVISDDMLQKASRDAHRKLIVKPFQQKTYVIVVAVDQDVTKNFINKISCKRGVPLGGYVYDAQSDTYYIDCADYLHLGYVPFSLIATMSEVDDWELQIPMPEIVIKKYLSPLQKKELRNFKNHFKSENFSIHYIQMVDPN